MVQHSLIHYTLNTADTYDCSAKQFNPKAIKLAKQLAIRAIENGSDNNPLPDPFGSFRIKVTVIADFSLFDIFDKVGIMTCNAVAWGKDEQDKGWDLFEQLYLKLSGQLGTVPVSRVPVMPSQIPWLATLILPNPSAANAVWLADFEQCMAISLIEAAKPERDKPKGFS